MKTLVQYIQEQLHYKFGLQFPNVLEMAQINSYENNGKFDKNSMKIQIYGGDSEHNPPHVHIMDKSRSFDIRVEIETGDLMSIKKGKKKESYSDIINDFKKWLDKQSNNPTYKDQQLTNQYMCYDIWNLMNPDKFVEINKNDYTL